MKQLVVTKRGSSLFGDYLGRSLIIIIFKLREMARISQIHQTDSQMPRNEKPGPIFVKLKALFQSMILGVEFSINKKISSQIKKH